jgi:hypothetical protein
MKKKSYEDYIKGSKSVLECLSAERIAAYDTLLGSIADERERPFLLLRTYAVIQMLQSLMLTPLHFLEICLRNKIYTSLKDFYSKTNTSNNPDEWYVWMPANARTQRTIRKVIDQVKSKIGRKRTIIAGDIVSNLTFGVWINILEEYPDNMSHLYFWAGIKKQVFPRAPGSRKNILDRLKKINTIRNRLVHHEPLWTQTRIAMVMKEFDKTYIDILEVLEWISPDCYTHLTGGMPIKQAFDHIASSSKELIEKAHSAPFKVRWSQNTGGSTSTVINPEERT